MGGGGEGTVAEGGGSAIMEVLDFGHCCEQDGGYKPRMAGRGLCPDAGVYIRMELISWRPMPRRTARSHLHYYNNARKPGQCCRGGSYSYRSASSWRLPRI